MQIIKKTHRREKRRCAAVIILEYAQNFVYSLTGVTDMFWHRFALNLTFVEWVGLLPHPIAAPYEGTDARLESEQLPNNLS